MSKNEKFNTVRTRELMLGWIDKSSYWGNAWKNANVTVHWSEFEGIVVRAEAKRSAYRFHDFASASEVRNAWWCVPDCKKDREAKGAVFYEALDEARELGTFNALLEAAVSIKTAAKPLKSQEPVIYDTLWKLQEDLWIKLCAEYDRLQPLERKVSAEYIKRQGDRLSAKAESYRKERERYEQTAQKFLASAKKLTKEASNE
jgi:hypothetical protein